MVRPLEMRSLGEVFATGAQIERPAPGIARVIWTRQQGEASLEVVSMIMTEPQLAETLSILLKQLLDHHDQPSH
ncbi:hypothetical protein L1787_07650 [Acuticoccus sp. M5D2P5]|uniref:hypothetical protein n=1 Tax=Acuticoccus kalidii TaxID=2910977 RepID=UPI001F197F7D|nr:hypothetical protein [Acuticoccus kalidii]MCF3933284.1 hypothetical protein [Acuticoccus kalidii]